MNLELPSLKAIKYFFNLQKNYHLRTQTQNSLAKYRQTESSNT